VRRLVRFVGPTRPAADEPMERFETAAALAGETAVSDSVPEDDDRPIEERPTDDSLVTER
jgi:hypothetical protein